MSTFEHSLAVAGAVPAAAPWIGAAALHANAFHAPRRRPAVDAGVPRLRVTSVPRSITFFSQLVDLEVLRGDRVSNARQVTLGVRGRAALVLHAEAPKIAAVDPWRAPARGRGPLRQSVEPVTLLVPDLERAVAAAWDAGATLSCDVRCGAPLRRQHRSAVVLDPDGNRIELVGI